VAISTWCSATAIRLLKRSSIHQAPQGQKPSRQLLSILLVPWRELFYGFKNGDLLRITGERAPDGGLAQENRHRPSRHLEGSNPLDHSSQELRSLSKGSSSSAMPATLEWSRLYTN